MMRAFLLIWLVLASPLSHAMRVAFVNPGKSDETYWIQASNALRAAAISLGVELEIHFAERDPLRQIVLTREIAQRPPAERPDYLIIAPEKRTLLEQVEAAQRGAIKFMLAFSNVLPEDRARFGTPRRETPLWLGSLVPHAEDAGALTAAALIERGLTEGRLSADGRLHILAIAGDRSTDVSIRRNRGMLNTLSGFSQVMLDQQVFGDWRRDKANLQARELLRRYPQTRLIWAGNDEMAFGAMDALIELGGEPGRTHLFSAINTSPAAMHALIDGRLTALAGGHFMAGAWALVMLYDYHHGHDFAESEGLELDRPMFTLFTPDKARRFLEVFAQGVPAIDFRRYSKAHQAGLPRYDFRFDPLLELH